jgi:SAM-dependent methyltransferase
MRETQLGWEASAPGWIEHQGDGDYTRKVLLDGPMLDLCGQVTGKRILDVGCGEGRFCRMLAQRGAQTVGLDPTSLLIQTAQQHKHPKGEYIRGSGEKLPFESEGFDTVVFYLSLIDIPDFRSAIREANRVLRPGGSLVAGNLASHATTLASSLGWVKDDSGKRLYFQIDNYLDEYGQVVHWKNIRILNWRRPLSAYFDTYLSEGLILKRFLEPAPTPEQVAENPSWNYDRRVPYTNAMLWQKP